MKAEPEEATHQRVLEASLSGDLAPFLSLFADDAVVMPNNDTTLFGKAELQAWWEDYFRTFRITSSVETERDIRVAGDQAFERHAFSVTIVPKRQGAKIRDDNIDRNNPGYAGQFGNGRIDMLKAVKGANQGGGR